MIETVILALVFARVKGIKLMDILRRWEFYPVFICAFIYIFLQIGIFTGHYGLLIIANIYKVIYSAAIFYLIYKFKIYKPGFIGMAIMFAGLILNQIVIHANGGKMPVYPTLSLKTGYTTIEKINTIDGLHIVGDSSTSLKYLSDIFDVGYCIMSIGDVLVRAFLFVVLYYSFKCVNKTGAAHATPAL